MRGLFFMKPFLFFLLIILSSLIQCNSQQNDSSGMRKKPIDKVIEERREMLLSIKGVEGFYKSILENGDDCIVIMIDTLTDEINGKLPDSLDGYPVLIEEGGKIKPLRPK
jgi:hypothetical protein